MVATLTRAIENYAAALTAKGVEHKAKDVNDLIEGVNYYIEELSPEVNKGMQTSLVNVWLASLPHNAAIVAASERADIEEILEPKASEETMVRISALSSFLLLCNRDLEIGPAMQIRLAGAISEAREALRTQEPALVAEVAAELTVLSKIFNREVAGNGMLTNLARITQPYHFN